MPAESIKEITFTVARQDEHAVKLNKLALHDQREIKEFFYKLEDVRGRIVVIR